MTLSHGGRGGAREENVAEKRERARRTWDVGGHGRMAFQDRKALLEREPTTLHSLFLVLLKGGGGGGRRRRRRIRERERVRRRGEATSALSLSLSL